MVQNWRATEELAYARRTLAENAARIAKQRDIVAAIRDFDSPEARIAQVTLLNLMNAQGAIEHLRDIIIEEIQGPIRR
jgi:hypothetical protein